MIEFNWDDVTGTLNLSGKVVLDVLSGWRETDTVLAYPVKRVDLGAVHQVDSAILAFFLVWSKNIQQPLEVIQPPEELLNLLYLYDMEEIVLLNS